MKRGKYIVIIILIFIFLLTLTAISLFYYEFTRPPSVKADSCLEINLSGEIQDFSFPDFISTFFLQMKPISVHDFWQNLRKAKADGRIRCLLLRLGYLECEWGKVSEMREAILDFRQSGKKVYAYIEEAPEFDKEYYLATACDRIILHPLGWLGINGIGGWVPFLKEGMSKLGIEAEFEQVEEFKTAPNMFTQKGLTDPHRMMIEAIYGDIYDQYVSTIAEARKKSEDEIKQIIDRGLYQSEEAIKAGMVDDLLYEDELEDMLKEEGKKLQKIAFSQYSRISPSSVGLSGRKKIALIYATGPIHGGEGAYQTIGSSTVSRWLRRARQDKSISAIVFRVDSPGGSAVASDVIWREVALAKKEKPFVVSMSDVAGSGGYWISMAAHKIVAQPQTLTGSIGVLAGKFNLAGLYEKLGITSEKLTFGQRADIFTSFRSWTPEERKFIKDEILGIYDQFLAKVAEGRNMTKEEVDKIGRGRVWTGNQAKEINLVDELGGLSEAMGLAKKLAGIPVEEEVALVVWPKKVSLFSTFMMRRWIKSDILLPSQVEKGILTLRILEKQGPWAVMPIWLPL